VELPGAELVEAGIRDLEERRETPEALLVSIGARRLNAVGFELPPTLPDPETRLYLLLAEEINENSDAAHERYNELIRRLVEFESAAEHAHSRGELG
jgi:hypothetical protein